jgi:(S)-2-hydroxyglutarate dehydrogenase
MREFTVKFDFAIIGGGVIGLAIARELKFRNPKSSIVLFEKESKFGSHASGRNSGVIHSGFYYSPESLKAATCREGNSKLISLFKKYKKEIIDCGKVVVAQTDSEFQVLEHLYKRGIENNINLELLDIDRLVDFEPLARGIKAFIWSPTTKVARPSDLTDILSLELKTSGVKFEFNSEVILDSEKKIIRNHSETFHYRHLVNAAGTNSDRIAHSCGLGNQFLVAPFAGKFFHTDTNSIGLKRLVYPVPNIKTPFLGVHTTMKINGGIKIGPNALPLLGREQYSIFKKISIKDASDSLHALWAVFKSGDYQFSKLVAKEVNKATKIGMVREASKIVPQIAAVQSWKRYPTGIRAQLINIDTGTIVQDFIIESNESSTHILNSISPAWTSALSFAEIIARRITS